VNHWKGWALEVLYNSQHTPRNIEYRKQKQSTEYRIQNTEYRLQSTEHRTQNTEYRVRNACHKIANVPVFIALGLNDFYFFGPKWHLIRHCHFRVQKRLDFQGTPLAMVFVMDVARITIITPRAI
jgi:hypothetical protein